MKEMNDEKFTKDNEFRELKSLLNNLPKVNAPDNFEFNLMTKIQNKSFDVKTEKKKSWLTWYLTPAISFAATVFVIVLFVFNGEETVNNPWETPPKLMEKKIAVSEVENIGEVVKNIESSNVNNKSKIVSETFAENSNKSKAYPFDKNSSINFDEYLQTADSKTVKSGAQLAGGSNSSPSPFDGFFLHQRKIAQKKEKARREQDTLVQKEVEKR